MACICGYNKYSNMARHKRTCKELQDKANEKQQELQELFELREENAQLKRELVFQKEERQRLQGRLEEARRTPPVVNNNTNNITINIVPYGQENPLSQIDVAEILRALPDESISRYVQLKHFAKPETANIRIPNKKGRTLQVVEEDKATKRRRWVDKDRKDMLLTITDTSIDELVARFDAEKYRRWNDWFEWSGLKEDGYDKTDAFKKVMTQIENVITSQNARNDI